MLRKSAPYWLHNIAHEVNRSTTPVGVGRDHRVGLDLGRPRCDLPPPARVRKLLKRGASIAELATARSDSAWAVYHAIV